MGCVVFDCAHHVTLIDRPYFLRSVTTASSSAAEELQVCLPGRQSGNQR